MLIKRKVLTDMIAHYPELEIIQPTMVNGVEVAKPNFYNLFDTYHEPETKRYYGEDFGFCKRWTKYGWKSSRVLYGLYYSRRRVSILR
jgi:hypothetical protein